MLINTPDHSSKTLGTLRSNSQFADVLLLIGKDEAPMMVHSAVLGHNSEYYNTALSTRRHSDGDVKLPPELLDQKTRIQVVLKHPDVEVDVMNCILDYLYTGAADIPQALVIKVALFANQILLDGIKIQIGNHLASHQGMTSSNALEYYCCGETLGLSNLEFENRALMVMAADLTASLVAGREWLHKMDKVAIAKIMEATLPLTAAQRWEILVSWAKTRQNMVDIGLSEAQAGIPPLFDADLAQSDMKDLINLVGLCELSCQQYATLVEPNKYLLSEATRDFVQAHFSRKSTSENSSILDAKSFARFLTKLTGRIDRIQPNNHIFAARLLHRASTAGFSAESFHAACDGKSHTVTLVKLANGKIIGGYGDSAWHSHDSNIPVKESFLFSGDYDTELNLEFFHFQSKDSSYGMYGAKGFGPVFELLIITRDRCLIEKNNSLSYSNANNLPRWVDCKFVEYEAASAIVGRFQEVRELTHRNLCAYLDISQVSGGGTLQIVKLYVFNINESLFLPGYIYTVSEHYPYTLHDLLLSKSTLSDFDLVSRLAFEMTAALAYLSKNGIAHLNLSLKNIQLGDSQTIKLSNYHLNHITNGGQLANVCIGYPEYLAPEMLASASPAVLKHGTKADVWSLGLILVDLCLGLNHRFPPTADITDILTTDYKWLLEIESDLLRVNAPPLLVDFIRICLTPSVSARPRLEELLKAPLFSKFMSQFEQENSIAPSITISDQFHLWRSSGSTNVESILSKRGVSNIPSIERLPLYISVSTPDDFDACVNPETLGSSIYQDHIHVFDMPLLDPAEIDIPNFGSSWKGMSEGWPVSKKATAMKPRKPLILKEKNAVYQCFRVLTFKQLVKEFPLSKSELVKEAAFDIPPLVRGVVWSCLLDVNPFSTVEYDFIDTTLTTPADRQLELDIPRCHQYNELISSPIGHLKMERILKAWVITETPNKNVYWQGLDSLLAPFLALNFTNEARAYLCFKAFIAKYFDGVFKEDNTVALNRCMSNVKYVLSFLDAQLAGHLMELGITPDMFAIPWVMTMFAQIFQLDRLYHLWDTLLLAGKEFPVFLVYSIIYQFRDQLLVKDFKLPPIDIEACIFTAIEGWRITPPSVCSLPPRTSWISRISMPDFTNHHIQSSILYGPKVLDEIQQKAKSAAIVIAVYAEAPMSDDESLAVETMVKKYGINRVSILVSELSRMPTNVSMCCCGATPQLIYLISNSGNQSGNEPVEIKTQDKLCTQVVHMH
ncbi:rab-GTPase-TBC domain-containing protein [Obelidium mucronatum]|nr:rab-GTPase-TBC domain-containing protein [Obelidium mucronatum]